MSAPPAPVRRWLPWIALVLVVVGGLAYGSWSQPAPSDEQRAQSLERTIRCPSCRGQSVANSETPSARAIKLLIRERVAAGDSDEQIRDYVASDDRFGREILLDPAGKGFSALVWGVPVVVAVLAVGALVVRFSDWRPGRAVTEADRDLVASALSGTSHDDPEGSVPVGPEGSTVEEPRPAGDAGP